MHEKMLDILFLCLKAKEKGHDVFFEYMPHVQKVSVCIHLNGWIKREPEDERHEVYIDKDDAEEKLLEIGNCLVELLDNTLN